MSDTSISESSVIGARFVSYISGLLQEIPNALEHRRLLVAVPFFLIFGMLVYLALPNEPDARVLAGGLVIIVVATALNRQSWKLFHIGIAVSSVWAGVCLLAMSAVWFGTSMLYFAEFGTYEVTIDKLLREDDIGQRIVVSNITPLDDADPLGIQRARILIRSEQSFAPGDVLQGRMRFAPVPGPVVPGGYDSQFHSYFDGIGSFGSNIGEPILKATGGNSAARNTALLRRTIGQRIDAVLEEPASGIARALTIGDQSGIADETRQKMAAAGLAHVLAISGLHLTLVAGGVFALVRGLCALSFRVGQLPIKQIAAIVGILAAFAYLAISGAGVSAVRATIMLVLVFGAVVAGRRALTMRNVAIAALLVIATDPTSVFRPGFQLSFAAVVGLVGVYEMHIQNRQDGNLWGRFRAFFSGLILTSLIAGGATAVFAAYHFQQTAPLGVLGNVFALPLVGLIVLPSAVAAILTMPLGMEQPFLMIMGWGIERILIIATTIASWSADWQSSPLLAPSALIITTLGFAWFAFFNTHYRWLGPILALVLVASFGLRQSPDILISDTTQAVAVRDGEGLALIAGRTGSFTTNVWSETFQETIGSKFSDVRCDSSACFAQSPKGFSISVIKQRQAFEEDCQAADIIVARLNAPDFCQKYAQVIDRDDLRTYGVQALVWNAETDQFATSVAIDDPKRPWRPKR